MVEVDSHLAGRSEGVLVVRVPERLTHDTAEPVRLSVERQLPNQDGAALVLDMSGVELVTSLGVATMLQIQEYCLDRGAPMCVAGLTERLRSFFEMLGLDEQFELTGTVEEAVAAVGG